MDIGTVGAAICYEHHMTLLRAALAIKGEEIHCALWPGWWRVDGHLGGKVGEAGAKNCDLESAIRQHAIENGVFVVSSSWFLRPDDIPADLGDEMEYNLAVGGSCVVHPSGRIVAGPVFGEETIVWADICMEDREVAKAYLDGIGHYSRPDLLRLQIRDEDWAAALTCKTEGSRSDISAADRVVDMMERYQITAEELESILADRG
jgi:amidase/nitrilase